MNRGASPPTRAPDGNAPGAGTLNALVWLWPFLTWPRLWYLHQRASGGPLNEALAPLLLGMARDGLLVGAALLAVAGWRRLRRRPATPGPAAAIAVGLGALVLVLAMADAQFFLYFGTHAAPEHLLLLGEWERISSSLLQSDHPVRLALALLVLPAVYVVAARHLPLAGALGRLVGGRWALVGAVALTAGLAAGRVGLADPLAINLADNFLIALVRGPAPFAPAIDPEADLGTLLDDLPPPRRELPDPEWARVDSRYPLVKATAHQRCRLGLLEASACARDRDGDGHALADDCNDRAKWIHPGAADVPRNGIDEDCSGLDADPPNVIFIHWEGVRAVNVGRLGHATPATPRFDRLSADGVLFGNAYANGVQTRWSLISVYGSILPRLSQQWIFQHHPNLELLSLPAILRTRGYETIYLHGGFIDFAGKGPRLSRWFETRIDRTSPALRGMPVYNWGLTDRELFRLARRLLDERTDPRPFFMTIATLSLHHPFGLPEPRFALGPHDDPRNQLANVIHYSDDALGEFLEPLLADPRFENTIVLVAADHGVNWFAPHPQREQNVLWEDLVWVPLALLGSGWNLPPARVDEVRQLADIPPTVLDRLGIEVPNPYVGRSLLRRLPHGAGRAFFATANGGPSAGVRLGPHKYFVHFPTGAQSLFDVERDREEHHDLSGEPEQADTLALYRRLVERVYSQNEALILDNRVWSWRWWIGERPPVDTGLGR